MRKIPAPGSCRRTGRLELHVALSARGQRARRHWRRWEGDEVTPFYDPMIAKIIVHGATVWRPSRKLRDACGCIAILPVKTNAGFLVRCLRTNGFVLAMSTQA